jgi:hypothetical protein
VTEQNRQDIIHLIKTDSNQENGFSRPNEEVLSGSNTKKMIEQLNGLEGNNSGRTTDH